MTLKFDRIQAGEYQVNAGNKMVGYICKKSSAKWILYKCSNPSLLGNPISVKKTLKELKIEAENLINSTKVDIQENQDKLDELIQDVRNQDEAKKQAIRDMLERTTNLTINLAEYKRTENGLEKIESSFAEIEAQEPIVTV